MITTLVSIIVFLKALDSYFNWYGLRYLGARELNPFALYRQKKMGVEGALILDVGYTWLGAYIFTLAGRVGDQVPLFCAAIIFLLTITTIRNGMVCLQRIKLKGKNENHQR